MPSAFASLIEQGVSAIAKTKAGSTASDLTSAVIQGTPALEVNRERVAAVLYEGFATYDLYAVWRPRVFWASVAGAIGSGYMLYKRRKIGREAWALWAGIGLGCAGLAYLTRPSPFQAEPPTGADATTFNILAYIDQKRAELKASDPNFPNDVYARFEALPVVKEQLDQTPLLKAL